MTKTPSKALSLRKDNALLGGFVIYRQDRKSTRLNSSHSQISYAVFCLKKKNAALGAGGVLVGRRRRSPGDCGVAAAAERGKSARGFLILRRGVFAASRRMSYANSWFETRESASSP